MQVHSIGNQNFSASLSGSYKSIIGNAIKASTPAEVKGFVSRIQEYFPGKDVDVWIGKPCKSILENGDIASVIVSKRGKYIPVGAKFTPSENAFETLKRYIHALKEISYLNLNRKADVSGEIHWLNLR